MSNFLCQYMYNIVEPVHVFIYVHSSVTKDGSSTGALGALTLFKIFKGFIFENVDCRTGIIFIVINMQCLQCLFYSLVLP